MVIVFEFVLEKLLSFVKLWSLRKFVTKKLICKTLRLIIAAEDLLCSKRNKTKKFKVSYTNLTCVEMLFRAMSWIDEFLSCSINRLQKSQKASVQYYEKYWEA